jgi:hypothetical protein
VQQSPDRRSAWTAAAGVATVAVTAALISFSHVNRVALAAGESRAAALLLPVSIDGAVVAAVAVILADSRAGRRPAGLTWLLLGLGLAGSLAANIASAQPTLTARAVAAWPPVALALGIEVLAGMARRREVAAPAHSGGPAQSAGESHSTPASATPARPPSPAASGGGRQLQLVSKPAGDRSAETPDLTDAEAVAAIRQLDSVAPGGRASRMQIQRRLGCGGSKAARLADLARQSDPVSAS